MTRALKLATLPATAIALVSCAPGPVSIPQPPQDVTAIAAVYATPTGTADPARLQQAAADAQARLANSRLDRVAPAIGDLLSSLRHRFEQSNYPVDPAEAPERHRPTLDAVISANRPCSAGGAIDLTAVVQDSELQRAIWGTANACQEIAVGPADAGLLIDGTVALGLQGPLPTSSDTAEVLVVITGQVGPPGRTAAGSVDFRIVGSTLEVRHAVDDGDVIVGVSASGITVRGKNGTFTCDLSGSGCIASS
jgi:hypothetical protein